MDRFHPAYQENLKGVELVGWEGDGNGGSDKVPQPGVEKLDVWWH